MATNPAERLPDLFSSHLLRCTRQRRALYTALAGTKSHPTADQLYHEVLTKCPGMSLATVYNTLEAFCRAGLAQKLPATDGSARFDAVVKNHLHVRLTDTGAVVDVPDDLSDQALASIESQLIARIEERMGISIKAINLDLVAQIERGRN